MCDGGAVCGTGGQASSIPPPLFLQRVDGLQALSAFATTHKRGLSVVLQKGKSVDGEPRKKEVKFVFLRLMFFSSSTWPVIYFILFNTIIAEPNL